MKEEHNWTWLWVCFHVHWPIHCQFSCSHPLSIAKYLLHRQKSWPDILFQGRVHKCCRNTGISESLAVDNILKHSQNSNKLSVLDIKRNGKKKITEPFSEIIWGTVQTGFQNWDPISVCQADRNKMWSVPSPTLLTLHVENCVQFETTQ